MAIAVSVNALKNGLTIWLRTNGDSDNICIDSFYIGKTENMDECKARHRAEGYCDTLEIAHGRPEEIKDAEPAIVDYFLKSNFADKCDNKEANTKGNDDADKLYIAFRAHYADNNQKVAEGEISWPESFELVGEKGLEDISRYISSKIEKDTLQEWLEGI